MNRGLWTVVGVAVFVAGGATVGLARGRQERSVAGPPAYDFPLDVYAGAELLGANPRAADEIRFSDVLDQGKPVILNFWAALCPPCRVEMPDFQAVANEYAADVIVLGIDIGTFTGLGTEDQGRQLLEALNITYPTATTSDIRVLEEYGVLGLPATYFILPNGAIHRKWTSILTPDKLRELLRETLEASRSL